MTTINEQLINEQLLLALSHPEKWRLIKSRPSVVLEARAEDTHVTLRMTKQGFLALNCLGLGDEFLFGRYTVLTEAFNKVVSVLSSEKAISRLVFVEQKLKQLNSDLIEK